MGAQKYHKGLARLSKALALLDGHVSSRTWLVGHRVTLADVILGNALSLYWIMASAPARCVASAALTPEPPASLFEHGERRGSPHVKSYAPPPASVRRRLSWADALGRWPPLAAARGGALSCRSHDWGDTPNPKP